MPLWHRVPTTRIPHLVYAVIFFAIFFGARLPAVFVDQAPSLQAHAAANHCGQNTHNCRWASQGEVYSDCTASNGLGYGCIWHCNTFWCSSSNVLDRGSTHATAIRSSDICTVTAESPEQSQICD